MKSFLNIIMIFFGVNSFAQVYNHGEIILENNAKLLINKELTNYSQGKINNAGTINIKGDWLNYADSNVFKENKGSVIFSGTEQSIAANKTAYWALSISKGSKTTLNTDITVDFLLNFNDGIILLNGHNLEVSGSSNQAINISKGGIQSDSFAGRVYWQILKGVYTIPFITDDGTGIPLNLDAGQNNTAIAKISTNTYHTDKDNKPYPPGISNMDYEGEDVSEMVVDRFWYIDPDGIKLNTTFAFADGDITGEMNKNKLKLFYHDGNQWILSNQGHANGDNTFTCNIDKAGWYALLSTEKVQTQDINSAIKILSIYPNPAKDKIFVEIPVPGVGYSIQIMDMGGKTVLTQKISKPGAKIKLDISNLTSGVYMLYLNGEKGNKYAGKFIK